MRTVISKKTSGVAIRHIISEYDTSGDMRLRISGVASLSGALPVFVDALRADSSFSLVEVPLSALANTRGGAFTVTAYPTTTP
jgi:hypothetical protein